MGGDMANSKTKADANLRISRHPPGNSEKLMEYLALQVSFGLFHPLSTAKVSHKCAKTYPAGIMAISVCFIKLLKYMEIS
jgi:hypothetical protein